jgi:hypothetical protein
MIYLYCAYYASASYLFVIVAHYYLFVLCYSLFLFIYFNHCSTISSIVVDFICHKFFAFSLFVVQKRNKQF